MVNIDPKYPKIDMNLYHVWNAVHSSAPYKLRKLHLNGHKGC